MKRPKQSDLLRYRDHTIPDVMRPGLKLLFVGINPSLYSAATGHHFARPGNRFWPALHRGGITDMLLDASEGHRLLDYGCGITNIVARATARADELDNEELREGRAKLEKKVRRMRPCGVVVLGVTAYRAGFDLPKASIGKQSETIAGIELRVLPNPSGLNAHYQLPEFARLFAELRQDFFDA